MTLQQTVQEQVLQRLGKVGIAARHAVESVLMGRHRSVHKGLSLEFAGHRPYQPGDDLRRLDWVVYARTDRYDIRLYEEETRLRATLVVDASGSMGYGSPGQLSKLDYARMLAAALGFLMLRQSDAVGLGIVDTEVREHLPPAATMGHLLTMLERLEDNRAGGETGLGAVLERLASRISRRGLVVLITDGFDDPERLLTALRYLHHRKQDIRIFQIVDPQEEQFGFTGMIDFVGMEHEPQLKLDGDRVRSWYQQALADHRRQLAEGCHSIGVQMVTMRTDEDLATAIMKALTANARRGGGRR